MNIMLTIAAIRNKINWCFNIIFLNALKKNAENEQEENDKECSLKWTLSS